MTLRFRISSAACFVFLLGVAGPLGAQQFVLYIAQVADGAGFFTEVSVNNPGSSAVACNFSTFDDAGQPLSLIYAPAGTGLASSFSARVKPEATNPPQSSRPFTVPPEGTATFSTSGTGEQRWSGGGCRRRNGWYGRDAGIGVPAVNTTTAFRVDGENQNTAFAFYNPASAIFYGSFRVPTNGQQFVALALGVVTTSANAGGYLLYTIPTLSGTIVGID